MKVLKKIKEKIMAMTNAGQYATGWSDPNSMLAASQQAAQLHPQLASAYQNALAQSMMQTKLSAQQAVMQNAFAQQQAIARTLSAFNLNANAEYTFEELNDEGSVYNMPLQTAVDLAINMFGSGWFKDEDTIKVLEENTDFLIKVMAKIYKAGRLKCETCRQMDTLGMLTAWKIMDTDHAD